MTIKIHLGSNIFKTTIMKYNKLFILTLLFLITLPSCNRIKRIIGSETFYEYIIEANNNTTEKDKEAINEYNYSVLLADSVLNYFNSSYLFVP